MPLKITRRAIAALVGAALVATAFVTFEPAAAPAQAAASCADSGCPDPTNWNSGRWTGAWGYPSDGGHGAGMNCTLYVAWRMVKAGVSASAISNWGNASQWDNSARAKGLRVDNVPAVGAIAQYEYGHVALVEAVNGDGTIRISESNLVFSGARRWLDYRTVSASSVDAFIHLSDASFSTAPALASRYGALHTNGVLEVKEGNPYSTWVTEDTGVTDFAMDGTRIADVRGGKAYIKDGALNAGWVELWSTPNAVNVYLDEDRIAVRTSSNELFVKDGIYSGWTLVANDVVQASMSMNRIGVRLTGGNINVKEGIGGAWTNVGAGTDVSLTGNRIAVVGFNGVATVKEGAINAPWTALTGNNSVDVEMTGYRIVVRDTSGAVNAKEGAINAGWVQLTPSGASAVDVSTDKVFVLYGGGVASVKQGNLYAGWVDQTNGVAKVAVAN